MSKYWGFLHVDLIDEQRVTARVLCDNYVSVKRRKKYTYSVTQDKSLNRNDIYKVINTFAASYLNTHGLNNSCLKSPASTLVDLTFQSRALRSFSLNQLRNLSL